MRGDRTVGEHEEKRQVRGGGWGRRLDVSGHLGPLGAQVDLLPHPSFPASALWPCQGQKLHRFLGPTMGDLVSGFSHLRFWFTAISHDLSFFFFFFSQRRRMGEK